MAINKRITLTVKYIDPLHIIKLAMHAHLQGLVDDLLEQRGESTQILGYQHLRLLPKLAAIEKVNRLRDHEYRSNNSHVLSSSTL